MHKNILSPVFHPSTCALDFMHFLEIRFLNSFKHQSAPQQPYTQCQQNLYFEFTDVFLPVFQKRVNLSLESGTVPRAFKKQSLNRLSKISKERKIKALDRQGTQQQRSESPTVTQPGVRVKTRHINSTKGTSSKKKCPQWHIYPPFQTHSATQVCTGT